MIKVLCVWGRCKHNSKGWFKKTYYGWCKLKQIKVDSNGCESYNPLSDEQVEKVMSKRKEAGR